MVANALANALAVALGGAIGSLSRWGISEWVQARAAQRAAAVSGAGEVPGAGALPAVAAASLPPASLAFPWGTLVVNALGSLLIGVVWGWLEVARPGGATRLFLVTGLLGGFTTFSTFSYDTLLLLQQGYRVRAVVYALGSMGTGVICAALGLYFGLALARSLA